MNDFGILETNDKEESSAQTGTVLTTIILLIATLLLTSNMLTHYLLKDKSTNKGSENLPFLAKYIQKTKESHSQSTTDPGINSLLSSHDLMNHWPRMKLAGFGKSEEETGNFAIINGRKIHPGQNVVGKVRLVEIRDHDVLVEYKGESRILTIEN